MQMRCCAGRSGFSMVELMTAMAICSLLVAFLLPAIQHAREQARIAQCKNNLRNLGMACHNFQETFGYFPRDTIRPRGTTPIGGEPPGSIWEWESGSYEPWHREIMSFIEQPQARGQDSLPILGCPTDPRGIDYTVPEYGFTWYVGVYSNSSSFNDGVIVDDSELASKQTISPRDIGDGMSQTILMTERPPSSDGELGWWDSRCCSEDNLSPIVGRNKPYQSGLRGSCQSPAYFNYNDYRDNCSFNSIWSNHRLGANFCMADGSVRTFSYQVAKQKVGSATLLEALASRSGNEYVQDY